MITNSPAGGGHPRGFDFNYEFWFECGCGQRTPVSDTTYDLQCQGVEPYPVCACGSTIDVAEARPTLRDLSDIDRQPEQVDRHVWYHSSTYQDWPSPTYRDNVAALVEQSLLPSDKHAAMIAERTSLALHLGTYAAAIENMLRRMADEGSPSDRYWLHQVEVRLQPGDLSPVVHRELAGWFGAVHISQLSQLDARAARYVNTHEAVGSISLAIDPSVIARVRTIPLPVASASLPACTAGETAATHAVAELAAAEHLRPDTTGLRDDQIFGSPLLASLEANAGKPEVDDRVLQVAQQMSRYRERQHAIGSALEGTLVEAYLADVNTQVRERFTRVMPTRDCPLEYHERFREMAGLLVQPHQVVQQFDAAPWRSLNLSPLR
ncbi:hypothetical protein [Prescottella equi]|uniref:hypothetical protein n=1 Tax=Rhodococcus hoagii TaxID=43767 RepID=UPI0027423631|nr:hypothetical protein [Prescottella equi]MDP8017657.1 hypothetical protein [Prescottella equi]